MTVRVGILIMKGCDMMAQTRKTRHSSSKQARSGNRPASSRRRQKKRSFWRVFFSLLWRSWFGRVCVVGFIASVVIGLNLLVSQDRYDLFFTLTGIELIVTALAGWLKLAVHRN
jgi:hypothetical protein